MQNSSVFSKPESQPAIQPVVIPPSIGRVVWFWQDQEYKDAPGAQPQAALVTYVHDEHLINVAAFGPFGNHCSFTSVPLVQPGESSPKTGCFAEWMPYQIGQATK